jgi:type IV pilus assembly protein PilO
MADFKNFQKLKWYYQILVVAGLCGGLLGLLWHQYLSPIETEIAAKQENVGQLTQQIAKSLQQKMALDQFKKEAAQLQEKLNELKLVLPLEKETDQILRSVQQSASSSALRILRVGPRPIIDHEVYTEWPIDMEVVGTYHNIGAFLDKIRQLPRIVNIGALRISSRASEGEAAFTSSVGATYTATTFVYRDEPITTTAPPARP